VTFNSTHYIFFLPLVFLVFYLASNQYRWLWLLGTSYVFYATFKAPQLLLALVMVTIVSYLTGIHLAKTADEDSRRKIFWLGSASCLLILLILKYLPPLLITSVTSLPSVNLFISIGVSYYCLQAISYLADVYLDVQEAEQHLGYYALYISFFPKLLQGPIERSGDLLPQLKRSYEFDYETMRSGMLLFTWGLFKKVVIADRLALYVNPVYNDVHSFSGMALMIATYAYAFQIFFDFSGYTDMARGSARIFGINLTENFNSPYLATSIADFWRRWHISFSRWILDYIFKPLQLTWRNWGKSGTTLALVITFLLSGLWHGITWGFLIWGVLHGIYLSCSYMYRPFQNKLHALLGCGKCWWLKVWQVLITFNLVVFAWIFFRANSLIDAWYLVTKVAGSLRDFVNPAAIKVALTTGQSLANIKALSMGLLIYGIVGILRNRIEFFSYPICVRWGSYSMLIFSLILLSETGHYNFVYFQF
jgi:D-alanyl-lipoteichoic acid acyltransferase DltB (MBOAT superfamily)